MSYLNKKLFQYCPLILTFLSENSPAGLEYVGVWSKLVSPELLYSYVLMINYLTVYNSWQVHMTMQQ